MASPDLRQFDVKAALTSVNADPAGTFRSLRERLAIPTDGPYLLPRRFASAVADASQRIMVFEHAEDFDASWEMARLSHRLGKLRDALAYANHAQDLQPKNPKVAARRAEILFDMHREIPDVGYDHAAQYAAVDAYHLEQSDYTIALMELTGVAVRYADDEAEATLSPLAA